MKFSEKYGYSELNKELKRESISSGLKTRLWNVLYEEILSKVEWPLDDNKTKLFLESCWDSILKRDIMEFRKLDHFVLNRELKQAYISLRWYQVFDLIEAAVQEFNQKVLKEKLNLVLKEEQSAYRIINNCVTEIISEEQIKEIEKAFSQENKFNLVKEHLEKSLRYISNREKPDYQNSIKESISSLESLLIVLTGKNERFGSLVNQLKIHPSLKESIKKLYGWASNEDGVRHGSKGEGGKVDETEARLILVLASALINYLISSYET